MATIACVVQGRCGNPIEGLLEEWVAFRCGGSERQDAADSVVFFHACGIVAETDPYSRKSDRVSTGKRRSCGHHLSTSCRICSEATARFDIVRRTDDAS